MNINFIFTAVTAFLLSTTIVGINLDNTEASLDQFWLADGVDVDEAAEAGNVTMTGVG